MKTDINFRILYHYNFHITVLFRILLLPVYLRYPHLLTIKKTKKNGIE